jgi:predicted transcriptional regulator of viral defense system
MHIITYTMTFLDFIKDLQSKYEYSLSVEEAVSTTGISKDNIRASIRRQVSQGKLKSVRQGFYIIIPPHHSPYGTLPLSLFVDKLMAYVDQSYYVGLYSAAKVYGASHQKVMQEFVMIVPPSIRDIDKGHIRINYSTVKNWPQANLKRHKSDAGGYMISSPSLTAIDLIKEHGNIGGISAVYTVLEELVEEVNVPDMEALMSWYPIISNIQRMGCLLEMIGADKGIIECITNRLSNENLFHVDLSKTDDGTIEYNKKWKVRINKTIESDLW